MAWRQIIWTNADPILWNIYAALGGDGLTYDRWEQTKHVFQFFIILFNWYDANDNTTHLSYVVNVTSADGLAPDVVRIAAVIASI